MNWKALQNGSDIRGVALEGVEGEMVNLTSEVVRKIGVAFAEWLAKQFQGDKEILKVGVGMDSRLSGPKLNKVVCESLSVAGCEVFNCGLASTPAMFMSTIFDEFDFDGAIMLTASHLPFNRNGLKFFTKNGGLEKPDISEILEIAKDATLKEDGFTNKIQDAELMPVYANRFVEQIRKTLS